MLSIVSAARAVGLSLPFCWAVVCPSLHSAEKVRDARLSAADFATSLDEWEYYGGYEFPGATGNLVREARSGPNGTPCARLTGDFTGGGSYVAMTKRIDAPCTGVSFILRGVGCQRVSLRLTDDTGQIFQQELKTKDTEEWQIVSVDSMVGKGNSWGGANDKIWHPPAKKISIMNCGSPGGKAVSVLQVAQVALHLKGNVP